MHCAVLCCLSQMGAELVVPRTDKKKKALHEQSDVFNHLLPHFIYHQHQHRQHPRQWPTLSSHPSVQYVTFHHLNTNVPDAASKRVPSHAPQSTRPGPNAAANAIPQPTSHDRSSAPLPASTTTTTSSMASRYPSNAPRSSSSRKRDCCSRKS